MDKSKVHEILLRIEQQVAVQTINNLVSQGKLSVPTGQALIKATMVGMPLGQEVCYE